VIDPRLRHALARFDQAPGLLSAVALWGGDDEPAAGSGWGFHMVPTLVLALDGVVRLEGPGRRIDLGAGQALLLEPTCLHRHAPLRPGCLALALGLLPAWCDFALLGPEHLGWSARLPLQPASTLFEQALLAAGAEQRRERVRALLVQVLAEPHHDLSFAAEGLWPMVRQLWSRPTDPTLTVDDLVRASGLSRAQAYRRFRASYGTTPAEAITATRLALARWLLLRGRGVAEAARRAGFPSRATFTRAWRRRFGAPPSEVGRE
jgi:AraC-like DNA-binding protein